MANRHKAHAAAKSGRTKYEYGDAGRTYLENLRAKTTNDLLKQAIDDVLEPEPPVTTGAASQVRDDDK